MDPDQGANGRVESYSIQSGESAIYTYEARVQKRLKESCPKFDLDRELLSEPNLYRGANDGT